jgi:hypothetical protein
MSGTTRGGDVEPESVALLTGMSAVPVITGIVAVVRPFLPGGGKGPQAKKWTPVVAIFAGICWSMGVAWVVGTDLFIALFTGVVVGLAAEGLYSTGKALSE